MSASAIVPVDRHRSSHGFAPLTAAVLEDPTLSSYAVRVFGIIRLHDFGAGHRGCFLPRAELASRGGMSEASAKRAIRELRQRGLIVTEESHDGQHPNVHRCAVGGVTQTPGRGHTDPREGSLTPPTGGPAEPPLYKDELDNEVEERKYTRASARGPTSVRTRGEARPQFAGGCYGVCPECGCSPCDVECRTQTIPGRRQPRGEQG